MHGGGGREEGIVEGRGKGEEEDGEEETSGSQSVTRRWDKNNTKGRGRERIVEGEKKWRRGRRKWLIMLDGCGWR